MTKTIDYAGKVVLVGKDNNNRAFLAYRVTSRSASERHIKEVGKKEGEENRKSRQVRIFPGLYESHAGTEKDLMWNEPYFDPYVCLRIVENDKEINVFASNGNQTNRVNSLVKRGYELKSAIIDVANNYDYEKHDVARVYAGLRLPTKDEVRFFKNPEEYIGILGVNNPVDFRVKTYELNRGEMFLVGSTKESWNLETRIVFNNGFDSANKLAEFISEGKPVKEKVLDKGKKGEELFAYVATAFQDSLNKDSFDIGIHNKH